MLRATAHAMPRLKQNGEMHNLKSTGSIIFLCRHCDQNTADADTSIAKEIPNRSRCQLIKVATRSVAAGAHGPTRWADGCAIKSGTLSCLNRRNALQPSSHRREPFTDFEIFWNRFFEIDFWKSIFGNRFFEIDYLKSLFWNDVLKLIFWNRFVWNRIFEIAGRLRDKGF